MEHYLKLVCLYVQLARKVLKENFLKLSNKESLLYWLEGNKFMFILLEDYANIADATFKGFVKPWKCHFIVAKLTVSILVNKIGQSVSNVGK